MTHPELQQILTKLRDHLALVFGDELVSLVLFGSQAREEATVESDIDLLVVLSRQVDVPKERSRFSEFLAALCLEYDVLITCMWTGIDEWQTRQSPLMLNIRREGILV
ncbi:MAG: nucleotidyltransferase domain-containing protein [Cyanobacteria bacterium J06621_11]